MTAADGAYRLCEAAGAITAGLLTRSWQNRGATRHKAHNDTFSRPSKDCEGAPAVCVGLGTALRRYRQSYDAAADRSLNIPLTFRRYETLPGRVANTAEEQTIRYKKSKRRFPVHAAIYVVRGVVQGTKICGGDFIDNYISSTQDNPIVTQTVHGHSVRLHFSEDDNPDILPVCQKMLSHSYCNTISVPKANESLDKTYCRAAV